MPSLPSCHTVSRWRSIIVAGSLLLGCASNNSGDETSSNRNSTAAPSELSDTTTPAAVTAPPTNPKPISTPRLPELAMTEAWIPPFALPGTTVTLRVTLPTVAADDPAVMVFEDGLISSMQRDSTSGEWTTSVLVDRSWAGSVRRAVVRARGVGGNAAETTPLVIPIAEFDEPVLVNTNPATPDWSTTVPWGDGPGQVGLLTPNDGEIAQPTSIAIDPRTEDPVVLDRVNRRLVIIGHDGNRDVPLPGTGFIYDVVIHGDTGVATVPRFDVVGQERTTTAIEVDLDAGTADTFGPVVVPSATPINTQFVWQPFNRSVYAVVDNVYYPYFDSNTQTLVAGESSRAWVDAVVNPDGSIGIGPPGSHMVHRFSRPAVGVVSSVVDGTSIWFEASIEGPPDADGNATFSPELVRTDAMHGTASAIQLRPSGFDSFTRRFAVYRDHAYVMSRAVDGLLIERYTIRQP
jgi:hypothetical protein